MTKSNIKVIIVAAWLVFISGICIQRSTQVNGQTSREPAPHKPDMRLIDRFDKAINARFLTQPSFGMGRIVSGMTIPPEKLRSGHLSHFSPQTESELATVKAFSDEGWDVGIYLYGRRSEPKVVNGKTKDKFSIRYRINQPVTVTATLKERDLQDASDMVKDVKEAFLVFQNSASDAQQNYEFDRGDWSYVARPVRAANQSCLQCHNDYAVIDKLQDGRFKFRKRAVGDVNGILLYAFRKRHIN
jgi:ribosomal protein S14